MHRRSTGARLAFGSFIMVVISPDWKVCAAIFCLALIVLTAEKGVEFPS